MKPKKVLIGLMVDEEQKALLRRKAVQNGRSLSNYLLWKLKDEFTEENNENSQDNPADTDRRTKPRVKRKGRGNVQK